VLLHGREAGVTQPRLARSARRKLSREAGRPGRQRRCPAQRRRGRSHLERGAPRVLLLRQLVALQLVRAELARRVALLLAAARQLAHRPQRAAAHGEAASAVRKRRTTRRAGRACASCSAVRRPTNKADEEREDGRFRCGARDTRATRHKRMSVLCCGVGGLRLYECCTGRTLTGSLASLPLETHAAKRNKSSVCRQTARGRSDQACCIRNGRPTASARHLCR